MPVVDGHSTLDAFEQVGVRHQVWPVKLFVAEGGHLAEDGVGTCEPAEVPAAVVDEHLVHGGAHVPDGLSRGGEELVPADGTSAVPGLVVYEVQAVVAVELPEADCAAAFG